MQARRFLRLPLQRHTVLFELLHAASVRGVQVVRLLLEPLERLLRTLVAGVFHRQLAGQGALHIAVLLLQGGDGGILLNESGIQRGDLAFVSGTLHLGTLRELGMFLRDVGVLDSQRLELLVELVRRVLGTLAGGVRFLRVAISLGPLSLSVALRLERRLGVFLGEDPRFLSSVLVVNGSVRGGASLLCLALGLVRLALPICRLRLGSGELGREVILLFNS